jgi:hypothetical protein
MLRRGFFGSLVGSLIPFGWLKKGKNLDYPHLPEGIDFTKRIMVNEMYSGERYWLTKKNWEWNPETKTWSGILVSGCEYAATTTTEYATTNTTPDPNNCYNLYNKNKPPTCITTTTMYPGQEVDWVWNEELGMWEWKVKTEMYFKGAFPGFSVFGKY